MFISSVIVIVSKLLDLGKSIYEQSQTINYNKRHNLQLDIINNKISMSANLVQVVMEDAEVVVS